MRKVGYCHQVALFGEKRKGRFLTEDNCLTGDESQYLKEVIKNVCAYL